MLLIGIAGALAQIIDGVLGMGYGVSAATLLITFGVMPAVVSATVHAAKLPTSAVSGLAHLKEGNVDRTIALPLGAGGVMGGVVGALVLVRTSIGDVKPLVALILIGLGVRMVVVGLGGSRRIRAVRLSSSRLVLLGFVGGSLDAFGGGGWGPTCTSVLMSADDREPRKLIGSVNLAEVAMAAAVVVTFVAVSGAEPFALKTALPLVLGGLIVAPFAAKVCARANPRVLAVGIGLALVALNSSTLASLFGAGWLQPAFWSVAAAAALTVVVMALRAARSRLEIIE